VFGHPSNALKDQVLAAYGDSKLPDPAIPSGSPAGAASLSASPAPSPLRTRKAEAKDDKSPLARPSHAVDEMSPMSRQPPSHAMDEMSSLARQTPSHEISPLARQNPGGSSQAPLAATPVGAGGFPPLFSNANTPRKFKFDKEFDGLSSSASSSSNNWRSFDNL